MIQRGALPGRQNLGAGLGEALRLRGGRAGALRRQRLVERRRVAGQCRSGVEGEPSDSFSSTTERDGALGV